MRKMTRAEAKRFAHREVANLLLNHFGLVTRADVRPMIGRGLFDIEPDGPLLRAAIEAIAEQHLRYGPKSTDQEPRGYAPHTTPLLDVIQNNEAAG